MDNKIKYIDIQDIVKIKIKIKCSQHETIPINLKNNIIIIHFIDKKDNEIPEYNLH